MYKIKINATLFLLSILTVIFLLSVSACSQPEAVAEEEDGPGLVKIVYVDWVSEIASAHVIQAAIEDRLNYECELLSVTAISMWESVAAGDQDAMLGAWLPSLQQEYLGQVEDQVVNLGPNLVGVEMGLVVPAYVEIDSITELNMHAGEFDNRIIGIDPEAGLMANTLRALEVYELDDFELISGSDLTMTSALEIAYEEERWIVVTGWTPHWKFARWDLKYLHDPEKVYGESEYIGTIVRQGLQEDMPEVYAFLDNFYWTAADMEQVMFWFIEDGMTPAAAAARWVEENSDLVDQWVAE